MKIVTKIISIAALAMGVAACSLEVEPAVGVTVTTEASFAITEDATRTAIGDDGMTTHWVAGDKLAVWAKRGNGTYAFENVEFSLRHFSSSYDKAYFTANVVAMAEGDYTYMLAYPQPKAVDGTRATYTLSATQSGNYDGIYDIMVAEPTVEGSLTEGNAVVLTTTMRHQMHAMKITVPEGRNLFGQRFYRLEITFPCDVVGDITVDVNNPDAAPVYTNTSNRVVVERAEGFDEGEDIWVFLLPGTVSGDVSYYVRGESRRSEEVAYTLNRTLKAGHVTPLNMAIPELYSLYTAVHFSVDQNYLGEDFNYLDVYDQNRNHLGRFERNTENKYTVACEGEFDVDQYDNTTWSLVFDTENTIVETTVNMGNLTDYSEHVRWVNIPYLFSENFAHIPSFSDGHDNSATGWKSDTYDSSNMLDSYTSLLSGWSGGRIGGSAGQSVRICCRHEAGLGAVSYYKGRVDTAPLSCIKSGKSVRVRVWFDYGANRAEYGTGNGNPTLTFGTTTSSGVIAPSDAISKVVMSETEVSDLSGSFTNTPHSQMLTVEGCTNATRLSWQVDTTRGSSFAGNGNYWIYLDNIKAQIIK